MADGLSVFVVHEEEVVFFESNFDGFGFRDLERQLPVTSTTMFGIGSTTKAFTSTLIGMLIDDAILNLYDPVTHFLPDFMLPVDRQDDSQCRTQQASLTDHDMLAHRTGVARADFLFMLNGPAGFSVSERSAFVANCKGPNQLLTLLYIDSHLFRIFCL
jgi:CubicO group peptidase (beta-lactamase class C family)